MTSSARLADFTTRGDYVHISSTLPWAVHGKGYWTTSDSHLKTHKAWVTVEIQYYRGEAGWRTVETKRQARYAYNVGGGKTIAREQCSSMWSKTWRSRVDIDIIGHIDSPGKKVTANRALNCTP
ncbi:MAG: hypothetical protein ACREXY_06345 [Gammaproteobacteria bacterium]